MRKKWILLSFILVFATIVIGSGVVFPLIMFHQRPAVTTQFPNRVQEVLPSVVHIMCDRWQGSGVAITESIVVTARHVIDGLNYTITLNDGTQLKGNRAISHKDYDVGFIKVEKAILKPAKFGSIKECVLGQPVFIIGSPYGEINFNSVTLGIISGLDRDWGSVGYGVGEFYGWKIAFTSDSGAHPGNSGGPVFTMDGVVRGLLVAGFSPVLNCSMPCDLFLSDIEIIKLMFAFNKYKVEGEREWIKEELYEMYRELHELEYVVYELRNEWDILREDWSRLKEELEELENEEEPENEEESEEEEEEVEQCQKRNIEN